MPNSKDISISLDGKKYTATVTEIGSTITVSSPVTGSKSAVIKKGNNTVFLAETMLQELVNESLGQGGWRKP